MNREQCESLIERILALPRKGELQVVLQAVEKLGTRFNDCAISQNTLRQQHTLSLIGRLGQKQATVNLNQIDDFDLIELNIDRLFENCAALPDDEELMPAPGERLAITEPAFNAATAALEIEDLGDWVGEACREGASAGIDLAGLLCVSKSVFAYGDSNGGFAFERVHDCDLHVTASGETGSGWAEHRGSGATRDQITAATRRAIDKCAAAQQPVEYTPRPSTVILEPQAVGDLLSMAFWYGFDQRAADEGRSAMSGYDDKLGDLTLYSDPSDPLYPTRSFSGDGQALERSIWLDKGQPQQLVTSRYWASHKGLAEKPSPKNLLLSGAGTPLDNLIADTEDGILVTRFWYIRATDPKTLGFTGMTRDGTYRVENGVITGPVVDMRWNDSVLRVLKNVSASGIPTATGEFFPMVMPALRVDAFNFTSLSN